MPCTFGSGTSGFPSVLLRRPPHTERRLGASTSTFNCFLIARGTWGTSLIRNTPPVRPYSLIARGTCRHPHSRHLLTPSLSLSLSLTFSLAHTHAYAHAHKHTYTHTHTHAYTHKHTRTQTHTSTHTRKHTHTHAHTHTHKHTHTHTFILCVCTTAHPSSAISTPHTTKGLTFSRGLPANACQLLVSDSSETWRAYTCHSSLKKGVNPVHSYQSNANSLFQSSNGGWSRVSWIGLK